MKPKKEAPIDTLALTELLGVKTHRRECRRTWSKAEDQRLTDRLAECYPQHMQSQRLDPREVDWDVVAAVFSGRRKANDCKKRWTTSLDPHLRRGKWTEEEDRHLVEMYNKYGAMWQQVASHIPGRTDHQCSKRYFEVLDPNVANRLQPWSEAEDLRLIDLVEQHGTKWRTIAQNLESRPPLTCRNRWRNLLTSVVRERASGPVMSRMSEVAGVLEHAVPAPEQAAPAREQAAPASEYASPALEQSLPPPEQSLPLPEPLERTPHSQAPSPAHTKLEDELLGQVRAARKLPATTEWSYALLPSASSSGGAHGAVASMEMVEALVSHAVRHNLKIEIHQHHHYRPELSHEVQPSPQSSHSFSSDPGSDRRVPQGYALVPDVHVTRFQHFNYLPSSTSVPQLQSSANSPDTPGENGKESDLRRLLNAQESYAGYSEPDGFPHSAADGRPAKRQRVHSAEADFYESVSGFHKQPEAAKTPVPLRPVSQHHPLHSTGATPGPEDWGVDEDDEDFMSAFGFHAYMRDKPLEPQIVADEAEEEFLPFNPS